MVLQKPWKGQSFGNLAIYFLGVVVTVVLVYFAEIFFDFYI